MGIPYVFSDQRGSSRVRLNSLVKKVMQLVKQLLSKDNRGHEAESFKEKNNNDEIASDNATNEYLEARLMELIASSPSSLKTPTMLRVVPACPDTICKMFSMSVQTNFQTAEAQVA